MVVEVALGLGQVTCNMMKSQMSAEQDELIENMM